MDPTGKKEILALNAFAGAPGAALPLDVARLVERRQRSFGATSVLFYARPLHVVHARGATLTTADGETFLDLYNNVPSVGHCHPKVVAAVRDQVGRLNIHTRYLFDVVHDYAERLLAHFPAPLTKVAFTCTGSESNDLALRLARRATGGTGVVVTQSAYHGNTAAVTEVSPSSYRTGGPPAFVRTVPPPHPAYYGADVAGGFAHAVRGAIARMEADGHRFAALLVDTIFSSDGVHADPPGVLAPAAAAARAAGGLLIADEVQPGFARTGTHMWGFARHCVVPDIVTLGKPMGNGMPLGGVVTRPGLLEDFAAAFGYFNTFGGNPVSSAAGLAVLDALAEDGLKDNALRVGAHIAARLADLRAACPAIGEVRGAGLYRGIDIVSPADGSPDPDGADALINALRAAHILIGAAGPRGHTLKLRPPLCLSLEQADQFVDALAAILKR
ncbi:aminotransferase class III-fold pyridoxal phosphate-dependent enzyme [Xanthobacter sp. KR7-225]|uniref:aspartate aminotransferase family protein n=1 Tax=Xanthobacter sp. KR7-225 TaxID=3156613 RepID=UPI0032B49DF2